MSCRVIVGEKNIDWSGVKETSESFLEWLQQIHAAAHAASFTFPSQKSVHLKYLKFLKISEELSRD